MVRLEVEKINEYKFNYGNCEKLLKRSSFYIL